MTDAYRVVYVGSGRKMKLKGMRPDESEEDWRERLAEEQQVVCNQLAGEGFRLERVEPISSSRDMAGGWTEGVWLYFRREE